ncbi:MAG: C1 family peptidase [Lachnospiraceae bacterium]|nr:C1 family peptidase [Lachnospiraceae bacterium]
MKELTLGQIEKFHEDYKEEKGAPVLNSAMAKTALADLAFVPMNAAKLNGDFEIELKTRGITAQQKSGRCWMFAALNIMREIVAEKCNLKNFELSQNYITFYDKLEKANNFFESVIANPDEDLSSQKMQYIYQAVQDGGFWGMAVDLIEKYGIVPKSANPESYQSEHTADFLKQINVLVKKDAVELRELVKAGVDPQPRKQEMLYEVYRAQCIAFGEPVREFNFEYRDKDDNYHAYKNLTPKKFYEEFVGMSLKDYVAVINEPTSNKKMNTPVVFHSSANMADKDLFALNISMDDLEELCVKQLRDGEPIWFACDVLSSSARKEGILDTDSFRFGELLGGVDLSMSKKDRLESRVSMANHAMLLTGVNFDENGVPERWRVENSWGKEVGRDGYFVASEKYFREFVYEAVINKKHMTDEQLSWLLREPVVLNGWEEE